MEHVTLANLMDMKWYFIVVLILIFLMTSNIEHLFSVFIG